MHSFFFCLIIFYFFPIYASSYSDAVYSKIKNIDDPTLADYELVQNYLTNGYILFQDRMTNWKYDPLPRDFQIAPRKGEKIQQKLRVYNTKKKDKSRCVIIYASFDNDNPQKLKKTIRAIRKSNYKGHVLYRIGGTPNYQKGDIVYSHLPGAYTVCQLMEAKELGYKQVLFLIPGMVPIISLNTIFDRIEKFGMFGYQHYGNCLFYTRRIEYTNGLNISSNSMFKTIALYRGVLGLNFQNKTAVSLLENWNQQMQTHEQFSFFHIQNLGNVSYTVQRYFDTSLLPIKELYVNSGTKDEEFVYDYDDEVVDL